MANALNKDITGKKVRVLGAKCVFQVREGDGGFGSVPFTFGTAVLGHWLDQDGTPQGDVVRIDGWDVTGIVD